MPEQTIAFATDENGCPIVAPAGTKWVYVKGYNPGQPGRPWYMTIEGKDGIFRLPPDAPPSALTCLPSGNYKGEFRDAANKVITREGFEFALRHIGKEPGPGQANEAPGIDPALEKRLDRLEEQNKELLGVVRGLVSDVVAMAKEAQKTQIEIVKVMPKAIEASAQMVKASHGGGSLAQAAEQIQDIWEAAPSDASQLSTVLNSPVVVGAAAALQKYMAKAAENGAETMASSEHNGRESMAERAARIAAAANDRARKAARS